MGVSTVIATLWQVDDKATALLMEKFYDNLKIMDKVAALQNAQLYLSKQSGYSDPYYCAPFQLVGFGSDSGCLIPDNKYWMLKVRYRLFCAPLW
jgi:CHAT domain-containing protein